MRNEERIKAVLVSVFEKRRVDSVLGHYTKIVEAYQKGDWELCLVKAGKMIEAVVKLLCLHGKVPLPSKQRKFSASTYAEKIINIPESNLPEDSFRRQIPRACIFGYEISSNRGGRHDSDEFDPNEMDSAVILPLCSWIIAELVRVSSKGAISLEEAQSMVESLVEKKYPIFDEVDGRIHIDRKAFKGAMECGLLILYRNDSRRISREEFIKLLIMNGVKKTAIKFERFAQYIDLNDQGEMKLHSHGRQKAEEIIEKMR